MPRRRVRPSSRTRSHERAEHTYLGWSIVRRQLFFRGRPTRRWAAKLVGYLPDELVERPGERRRDRKSTRAAAACAASGSAGNVRRTGNSSTLDISSYSDVAARCVELISSSPARSRRVCRLTKLGPPAPARAPSELHEALALTMCARSAVVCAGSSKTCSSSGAALWARARSCTSRSSIVGGSALGGRGLHRVDT